MRTFPPLASGAAAVHGERPNHLILNPITIVGALIAVVGMGGAGFALVAGFLEEDPSAVKGILGYVVMPNVALAGVTLMIAGVLRGAWKQARWSARVGERPGLHIDIGTWKQLFGIAAFAGIALGSLLVLGGTTYRAIEFTESTTFCGTCHTVMEPQVDAHLTSTHASVDCAQCHVAYRTGPLGPNTMAYVNSKIGGLRQMAAVITGTYDTPIHAPSDKIPATSQTCEGCHASEKDYGTMIRSFTSYAPDEPNTRHQTLLAFPVGGGTGSAAHGIHWHATTTLWYTATDDTRGVISWVGVETANGLEEWVNPNASLATGTQASKTKMTCIDCHNRAGHQIPSPDKLVDEALDDGRLPRDLPFIKAESVRILGGDGVGSNPDLLAARFKDPTWFSQLTAFYWQNYPSVVSTRSREIAAAEAELKKMSEQVLYPEMKTDWLTYPDNLSHQLPAGLGSQGGAQTPGCFRCHGTLVKKGTTETLKGTLGGDSCLACHGFTEGSQIKISPGNPINSETCTMCHVNVSQPQLAGDNAAPAGAPTPQLPNDSIHQPH